MNKNIDLLWDEKIYGNKFNYVINTKPVNSKTYFINSAIKKLKKNKKFDKIRVLEIGCGYGQNLIPILNDVNECIGIDPSKKSVKVGKEITKKFKFIVFNNYYERCCSNFLF